MKLFKKLAAAVLVAALAPVSYTHLDVYKRQDRDLCRHARRRHDEADRRQVSAGPGKISGGGRT